MAMSRRFTDLWVLGAVLAYLLVCWLVVAPGGAGTSTSLLNGVSIFEDSFPSASFHSLRATLNTKSAHAMKTLRG